VEQKAACEHTRFADLEFLTDRLSWPRLTTIRCAEIPTAGCVIGHAKQKSRHENALGDQTMESKGHLKKPRTNSQKLEINADIADKVIST
jgi:hypothetical protein